MCRTRADDTSKQNIGTSMKTSSFTLHWSSSLSCMNEYLAINSDGLIALTAAWLDTFKRNCNGVQLNRSVVE